MFGLSLISSFVLSRTPYRISFFGGGTDYPAWYRDNPGAVLATSIDKYCYLLCRWLPPFFEHKHHIAYSQVENPQEIDEIRHPAVRETLKFLGVSKGVGIHHAGDLPHMTGIGTSSAFTIGLLNAFYALMGRKRTKMQLAEDAIHIEQDMIGENVGSQDQTTSAFGGFNRIDLQGSKIKVTPVRTARLKELEECLLLLFTGFTRIASTIAGEQIQRVKKNAPILKEMYSLVGEGEKALAGNSNLSEFGRLLNENWKLKRELSQSVSMGYIDYLHQKAIESGATGGKLLGAGGGGFLLFFVEPDAQTKVKESLRLLQVPFHFENQGSRIILSRSPLS